MELTGRQAHIGDFTGRVSRSVKDLTVLDSGSADAGADGYGEKGRDALAGTEPVLPKGCAVGIDFDADRKVKL